ncbi:MAG: hypothetical protein AAB955_02380 [Patescibacteria group bacterium]
MAREDSYRPTRTEFILIAAILLLVVAGINIAPGEGAAIDASEGKFTPKSNPDLYPN